MNEIRDLAKRSSELADLSESINGELTSAEGADAGDSDIAATETLSHQEYPSDDIKRREEPTHSKKVKRKRARCVHLNH